ncbi:MAG TPA: tryptophan 2,3-dioxygenase family protein [Candidatus Sulfotelmatobacter sp.]|nr:tryptophan 2,3-dioxygenase family protein [Candidatus Sulfotelmatobacter sp.]
MPVIDIHNHFFPREWPDLAARFGTGNWPWIKHTEPGKAEIMLGNRFFRHVYAACWDPQVRLEEMDRDGVDMQVISATPVLFAYERPVEHALDCAKLFNDAALELCAQGKGRLKSLCQVPLQDPDAACKELSRCMRAGHLGVQIGNHVGEKNLDDPGIVTFLHHCANEGAPVLVHPWDMLGQSRMPKYMMPWTVAMPAETQLGIVALILSGAFDKLPRNLKICFAHGGGSFAFLLGRLQNAWEYHPVARGVCALPPKEYVDRFSVDSAVFDQKALKLLVETMGPDRVMLGSDYPFPLGEHPIGGLIRSSDFAADIKDRMLGGNAAAFLGLKKASTDENLAATPTVPHTHQLTYSSYLRVPQLLELQHPQSSPQHHDELLFIIVHQTYELWFKELLHDLDGVVRNLRQSAKEPKSHDAVYEAARLLRRCTEITRVLVEQFTILETMLPTHFLAFRGKLEPASGFQSEQFRELEFLCGLKDEKMLRYHRPTPEAYAQLERRLREPSLHDVFFDALRAMGKLRQPEGADEREKFEARARAVLSLYRDEHSYRDWIDVCERLTEFDELVVSWRLRHIQLVERVIGARMGTGGSPGSSYLKLTLDKKFFPELWEARTLLTQ